MKRLTILALALACIVGWTESGRAQVLTAESLEKLAKRLRFFVVIQPTEKKPNINFWFGVAAKNLSKREWVAPFYIKFSAHTLDGKFYPGGAG